MIDLCVDEGKKREFGACLKVIGVGGAGGNAVNSMIESADVDSVSFIIANTDAQALEQSPVEEKIQLGAKITKGLGAGSNPDVGRRSAEEDLENIARHVGDADILFLTGGLGGGTGSGAVPVIANVAREKGVLTVAIVTKPFIFEGKRRLRIAQEAIENLQKSVDTLIVVPNQRLLEIVDEKISMLDAFALSNDILKQAIKGISDIITRSGHINVDFADVRAIMKDMGMALMGTGKASGQDRAKKAALQAISSPLLENVSIEGAKGVLINITGNTDLGLFEINEAASVVYDLVSEDANIILGSVIDADMGDEIKVTVIATGFDAHEQQKMSGIKGAFRPNEVPKPQMQAAPQQHVESRAEQPKVEEVKMHEPVQHVQHVQQQKEEKEEALHVKEDKSQSMYNMDDLDTPTFMRKKQELQQKLQHKNKSYHDNKQQFQNHDNKPRHAHEQKNRHEKKNEQKKHQHFDKKSHLNNL